jgi:hypothetical protein
VIPMPSRFAATSSFVVKRFARGPAGTWIDNALALQRYSTRPIGTCPLSKRETPTTSSHPPADPPTLQGHGFYHSLINQNASTCHRR